MRVGLLLIVAVVAMVFIVFAAQRRRTGAGGVRDGRGDSGPADAATASHRRSGGAVRASRPTASTGVPMNGAVAAALNRAVARGQISRETADAILEAERVERTERTPTAPAQALGLGLFGTAGRERRVAGAAVEAVGYLGSVLALVGLGFFVGRSWDDIGQPGRIGMFGGLAALALVVGILLRDENEVVIWRLRNVVLLLSTASLLGCTAVVVVDTFDWSGEPVSISIGLVAAVYSAILWARRDRPAQHLTMMVGSTVAAASAMAWWGGAAATGFTVLGVGILWLALARVDAVPPRELAVMLGLLAALIGPAITSGRFPDAAPAIGLAVAVLLLVVGGVTHEFVFTGFAVVGLLAYLTFGVSRWFGDSLKTPGVLLVAGIALLIATVVVVKRGRNAVGGHGSPSGAH